MCDKRQKKITYDYKCLLCPTKKEFVCKRTIKQHLIEFHSGFGYQCTGCNKTSGRKMRHPKCNGALVKFVKRTSHKFGENEKKEFLEFKNNFLNHVESISREAGNTQAKENRTRSSLIRTRSLDKPRRPFQAVTERNITHRASSLELMAKRTKVDRLKIDMPTDSNDSILEHGNSETSTQVQPFESNRIGNDSSNIVEKLHQIEASQESPRPPPVHLIVRGIKFVTSIPTLTAEPSVLSAMVAKDSIVKPRLFDNIPTYSLDRKATEFSVILDYLQNKDNGRADFLPHTTWQLDSLLLEAKFYELKGLEALINTKLDDITWRE